MATTVKAGLAAVGARCMEEDGHARAIYACALAMLLAWSAGPEAWFAAEVARIFGSLALIMHALDKGVL